MRQLAALVQGDREQGEQLVAVHDRARGVDGEAPVGVAVVRQAERGAVLDDGRLQGLQVGRAAAVVDALAVAVGVDRDDVGARTPVDLGRELARRPLRAVDDDLEPAQRRAHRPQQRLGVPLAVLVAAGQDPADLRRR